MITTDCIFCSIASDSSKLTYDTERVAAFPDIHPDAPVHMLVVPKAHIAKLDDLVDRELMADLLQAIQQVAASNGITGAYRVITNNGRAAGQIVDHMHWHVQGGWTNGNSRHL